MKKALSVILSLILVLSACAVCASAADEASITVYVTIADETGATVVAAEKLTVTDADSSLTVNDVLYAAHEQFYDGGAAAGYATSVSEYGLGLQKLWGVTNGGSYGYYINNASAWALTDPVADGDYVAAIIYTDTIGWSDHYSYFDRFTGAVTVNEPFTLTYLEAGYDAEWKPVTLPVEGAVITVDSKATEFTTDAEGKATVTLADAGVHTVSAVAEGRCLVAPVFIADAQIKADVYVTIADAAGATVVAAEKLTVTDVDADNALTVNDVLYTAHEQFYNGGAAAGYATYVSEYGLGLSKLWGSTCGSYGYYVNNVSSWALTDPVTEGDYITAFVYTDTTAWSDHYSYFDRFMGTAAPGEAITLTYTEAGYDTEWKPVTLPVEGAVIIVDDEATALTTDAEGKVTFTVADAGTHTVTAAVDGRRLVAPVFIVEVKNTVPGDADGDGAVTIMDATRIQRYLAKLIGEDGLDMAAADADGDGKVTIMDATRIQRYLAKLIPSITSA